MGAVCYLLIFICISGRQLKQGLSAKAFNQILQEIRKDEQFFINELNLPLLCADCSPRRWVLPAARGLM